MQILAHFIVVNLVRFETNWDTKTGSTVNLITRPLESANWYKLSGFHYTDMDKIHFKITSLHSSLFWIKTDPALLSYSARE